jgi:hypothetical protein
MFRPPLFDVNSKAFTVGTAFTSKNWTEYYVINVTVYLKAIWNELFSSWYAKIKTDLMNRERRIQKSMKKKPMLTASHLSEHRGRKGNVEQNFPARLQVFTSWTIIRYYTAKKTKLSLYLTN